MEMSIPLSSESVPEIGAYPG